MEINLAWQDVPRSLDRIAESAGRTTELDGKAKQFALRLRRQ
jgi:hypothetical protein